MARSTSYIDAQTRELDLDGPSDLVVNQSDDLGDDDAQGLDDPNMALAERVRHGDVSVMNGAFIAAGAVYGYSLGGTIQSKVLGAAVGAAAGVLVYELAHGCGWVE